ncbi:MAG: ribulose phosphate epimerase [Deltaproteobacteria bacterium]|nr:ribulose phosphate epimerase [Deltaproteobacteria bacterium]
MRTKFLIGLCVSAGVVLGGCGTKSDSGDGVLNTTNDTNDTNEESSGSAEGGSADTGSASMTTSATDSATSGPADTGSMDTTGAATMTGGFIQDPDGGGVSIECDLWSQDCPEGEKCMPWANDGGGAWNATRCSPMDEAPASVGDECTVEGTGVSGIDNCELGSMCWDVDGETNMGTCAAFCMGSEAAPVCNDPTTDCVIANNGTLILCLPVCDPLLQDCAEGQACYPIDDGFACAPDASMEDGAFGAPCEFINVCDPGLFCANADGVPDCGGSSGCCSPFCDTSDPMASGNCPGAAGGQECVAWYDAGQAPPGFENVGGCLIPM